MIAMSYSDLPTLNAALNAASAGLLVTGYLFIRRGRRRQHQIAMLLGFTASTFFLASYLLYHAKVGSVPFTGRGWIRPVYFVILLSHILFAAVILPLALATLYQALRGQFSRHVRIARVTLPIWLYVSVTGVVIYGLLYWAVPSR